LRVAIEVVEGQQGKILSHILLHSIGRHFCTEPIKQITVTGPIKNCLHRTFAASCQCHHLLFEARVVDTRLPVEPISPLKKPGSDKRKLATQRVMNWFGFVRFGHKFRRRRIEF